ncbi:MAG: TetR/AcrR family transcriptional regulator [Mycobacteriaceae bacterium]
MAIVLGKLSTGEEVTMPRVPVEERRQQLVDATIRVMVEHGVAAATTRRIAAEANTTLATVHYCFESKQALFREVITAIVNELALPANLELPRGADLPALVQGLLETMWATIELEPKRQQLTYEITQFALREPELVELARWQYALYNSELRRILDTLSAATGTTWTVDLGVLARMFLAAIDGAVLAWLVDGDSASARTVLLTFGAQLVALARPGNAASPVA